jgi:hypothetical protein
MAIGYDTKSDADHMTLLEGLISKQGIGPHGLFLLSGEGQVMPNGYEETSGYVVCRDGGVFFFWTGWDEQAQHIGFKIWEHATPQPDWLEDDEYQAAQRAAGRP